MVFASVLGAFFVGLGYLGLQSLLLDMMVLVCDQPRTALFIHIYLLLITILVATYIIDGRPAKSPEKCLRVICIGVVISHAFAYLSLNWLIGRDLTPLVGSWAGGILLTLPAATTGMAFGWYFQILLRSNGRHGLLGLIAVSIGALTAALRAKLLVLEIGSAAAFVLILMSFVAILALIPPPTPPEDRQPSTW
ncbi:MAG: hypothetical protein AB7F86_03240 [Bdellovibrionales bacterium]